MLLSRPSSPKLRRSTASSPMTFAGGRYGQAVLTVHSGPPSLDVDLRVADPAERALQDVASYPGPPPGVGPSPGCGVADPAERPSRT